jgi:hypothetical protein
MEALNATRGDSEKKLLRAHERGSPQDLARTLAPIANDQRQTTSKPYKIDELFRVEGVYKSVSVHTIGAAV